MAAGRLGDGAARMLVTPKLIAYDFDGVMTDNRVYLSQSGQESVRVSRADGHGVRLIREQLGVSQVIISTETNPVVQARAEKLQIPCLLGVEDKLSAVRDCAARAGVGLEDVLFVGNDTNDVEAMAACGQSACPADAEPEAQSVATVVLQSRGGRGVIRELCRLLASDDPLTVEAGGLHIGMLAAVEPGACWAIIPARSGSKGVPGKNIRPLMGFPLIAWSIAAAHLAETVSRVIVSTDSQEYADIATRWGAETPFLRPAELSGDTATDLGFMSHAIATLHTLEGRLPEYWLHLRPTCPFRDPGDLDAAVQALAASHDDSLRSAAPSLYSPHKWFNLIDGEYRPILPGLTLDDANSPRQAFPVAYVPDGYADVLRTECIIRQGRIHGRTMRAFISAGTIDIDNPEDFDVASHSHDPRIGTLLAGLQDRASHGAVGSV
jgi:N-acylneuraminate cytidylyltransferase